MNNEYWVYRINYLDIFKVVVLTCHKHYNEMVKYLSLGEILHYDLWARDYAASLRDYGQNFGGLEEIFKYMEFEDMVYVYAGRRTLMKKQEDIERKRK